MNELHTVIESGVLTSVANIEDQFDNEVNPYFLSFNAFYYFDPEEPAEQNTYYLTLSDIDPSKDFFLIKIYATMGEMIRVLTFLEDCQPIKPQTLKKLGLFHDEPEKLC